MTDTPPPEQHARDLWCVPLSEKLTLSKLEQALRDQERSGAKKMRDRWISTLGHDGNFTIPTVDRVLAADDQEDSP